MGTESPFGVDYAAVLADLEARKAQIESAISVIKALIAGGMPPPQQPIIAPSGTAGMMAAAGASSGGSFSIESDTFFGLSILDATKKFLAMRKRPSTGPEIVEALRQGGQVNAQNETFGNTLGATLSRSDAGAGAVVRVGRGKYGLREWYANKPRSDAE